jgi:hypothetical protein
MNTGTAFGLLLVFAVAVWFAGSCLRDLARTPDHQLRVLTKPLWAILIVVTIPIGGLLYLRYGKSDSRFG